MRIPTSLQPLLLTLPQRGRVTWIGLSSGTRGTITAVERVELAVGTGLVGDHHSKRRPGGKRQVTLLQHEHLPAIASLLGRSPEEITPELLRRNLLVAGINLLALRGRCFRIGSAVLEGTGPCDPCARMEDALGPGGLNAMRGHGGLTARVIEAGCVAVGDEVEAIAADAFSAPAEL